MSSTSVRNAHGANFLLNTPSTGLSIDYSSRKSVDRLWGANNTKRGSSSSSSSSSSPLLLLILLLLLLLFLFLLLLLLLFPPHAPPPDFNVAPV